GAEPSSGDGAGILLQVPDVFFRAVLDTPLPAARDGEPAYAVGLAFLPDDDRQEAAAVRLVARIAAEEGLDVLAWRDVPTDHSPLGPTACSVQPRFRQVFLAGSEWAGGTAVTGLALERRAFCVRKRVEHESAAAGCGTYFPSLSARTLVYKGMLTT